MLGLANRTICNIMDFYLQRRLGLKPKLETLKLPYEGRKGLSVSSSGREKGKLLELPCRRFIFVLIIFYNFNI